MFKSGSILKTALDQSIGNKEGRQDGGNVALNLEEKEEKHLYKKKEYSGDLNS